MNEEKRAGEISPALRRIKEAYFDGFNQAHYAHVHPELFPAGIKECEQAAEEYMAEKFPPTPAHTEQPADVSDTNVGDIREDIMDWIHQHPDANYVTMHGVYTGFGPDYWAGVMRMYRQQLPVIAKLTKERDTARQDLQKMIDDLGAKMEEAADYRQAINSITEDCTTYLDCINVVKPLKRKYPSTDTKPTI